MIHHLTALLRRQNQQGTVPNGDSMSEELRQAQAASLPVFPRLFPNPTGDNGYEEILQAGDVIRANATIWDGINPTVTLTRRRAALADVDIIRALSLLRRGLNKPIQVPVRSPLAEDSDIDHAPLRSLARLLCLEQAVFWADGKTGAAINNLRDGYQLASTQKDNLLLGALTGMFVAGIVLATFATHLDQLSARDCARLLEFARDILHAPNPFAAPLESERRAALAAVPVLRDKLEKLSRMKIAGAMLSLPGGDDPNIIQISNGYRALLKDSALRDSTMEEIIRRINTHHDALSRMVNNPLEKIPLAKEDEKSFVAYLMGTSGIFLLSSALAAVNKIHGMHTRFQLLGVHAAIRGYRWEHDALPADLSILRLKDLETDIFAGRPLTYQPINDTEYTLSSIGCLDLDENWQPINVRSPITLPSNPRKTKA